MRQVPRHGRGDVQLNQSGDIEGFVKTLTIMLTGRFLFWVMVFSFSLIGVGWFLYDSSADKSWGRVAVGIANQLNGMAVMAWLILRKK